jgi:uncharacterized protein Usg
MLLCFLSFVVQGVELTLARQVLYHLSHAASPLQVFVWWFVLSFLG